jgi:hypothetical protein
MPLRLPNCTDSFSQSRSSLRCLVSSSNRGYSSAPGLMFSQAVCHLTPTSYTSNSSHLKLPDSRLCRCSSWYSPRMDPTENNASNSSPAVAWRHCCRGRCLLRHRLAKVMYLVAWCVPLLRVSAAGGIWRSLSHCLAADVFTEPFSSNNRLCWLHNPGCQHVYDSTYIPDYMKPHLRRPQL